MGLKDFYGNFVFTIATVKLSSQNIFCLFLSLPVLDIFAYNIDALRDGYFPPSAGGDVRTEGELSLSAFEM